MRRWQEGGCAFISWAGLAAPGVGRNSDEHQQWSRTVPQDARLTSVVPVVSGVTEVAGEEDWQGPLASPSIRGHGSKHMVGQGALPSASLRLGVQRRAEFSHPLRSIFNVAERMTPGPGFKEHGCFTDHGSWTAQLRYGWTW